MKAGIGNAWGHGLALLVYLFYTLSPYHGPELLVIWMARTD